MPTLWGFVCPDSIKVLTFETNEICAEAADELEAKGLRYDRPFGSNSLFVRVHDAHLIEAAAKADQVTDILAWARLHPHVRGPADLDQPRMEVPKHQLESRRE